MQRNTALKIKNENRARFFRYCCCCSRGDTYVDFIIGQFLFHSLSSSFHSIPFNFSLIYCWCCVFFPILSHYIIPLILIFARSLSLGVSCTCHSQSFFSITFHAKRLLAQSHVDSKHVYTWTNDSVHVYSNVFRYQMRGHGSVCCVFFFMNWQTSKEVRENNNMNKKETHSRREEFLFNWTTTTTTTKSMLVGMSHHHSNRACFVFFFVPNSLYLSCFSRCVSSIFICTSFFQRNIISLYVAWSTVIDEHEAIKWTARTWYMFCCSFILYVFFYFCSFFLYLRWCY